MEYLSGYFLPAKNIPLCKTRNRLIRKGANKNLYDRVINKSNNTPYNQNTSLPRLIKNLSI